MLILTGFMHSIFWGLRTDFPVLCAFSGLWGFPGEPEFNAELDVLAEVGQYFPIWLQCKSFHNTFKAVYIFAVQL